jgi:hypothetical protein
MSENAYIDLQRGVLQRTYAANFTAQQICMLHSIAEDVSLHSKSANPA